MNGAYYYHSDHLGSAQVVTNHAGAIYERFEYTPYGEVWIEWANSGVAHNEMLPFRFTGKELDEETGLYYYGARYLDPRVSRWLSADPAMGEYLPSAPVNDEARRRNGNLPGMGGVFNYVNLHAYHYAGNNPVRLTDPTGRTIVINDTSNWIIIRGGDAEIHAVRPGETYNTKEHRLKDIDGILMHDGMTYKTNDGNENATFTISENSEGSSQVRPNGEGHMVNIKGDRLKNLYNFAGKLFTFLGQLEKSGTYKKGDDSSAGGSWWESAMKTAKLTNTDINNDQSWNSKLAEFRTENPDGMLLDD
jgi:RHS repeat-associated protein